MKRTFLAFLYLLIVTSSINADEITLKIPLDIDALPNNNTIVSNGSSYVINRVRVEYVIRNCHDTFNNKDFITGAEEFNFPLSGLHETVEIKKSQEYYNCGDSTPRYEVSIHFKYSMGMGISLRKSFAEMKNILSNRNIDYRESATGTITKIN